jgi:hypothetical protein
MSEESEKGESGRTLFTRLADAGEEAIQRVGEMPGVGKLAEPIMALRERVDELQRRMRGLDALERRLADVERRLTRVESDVAGGDPIGPIEPVPQTEAAAGHVSTDPPSTSAADFPANDPTGGTAGSEETGTSSSQAP